MEPRSAIRASDYTEDINRNMNKDKVLFKPDFSWIKDTFDPKGQVTPEDYMEWAETLCKENLT